jgi:hypothetical protein
VSIDQIINGSLYQYIERFILHGGWSNNYPSGQFWVSVFRVYRVPLDGRFATNPVVADLGETRAVFTHWEAPWEQWLFQQLERTGMNRDMIAHSKFLDWATTENGALLLLITPSEDEGEAAEALARQRTAYIRSVVVAVLGRNAAFEHLFEYWFNINDRTNRRPDLVFDLPLAFAVPEINPQGIKLVSGTLAAIEALGEETQNRIRLALLWYERAIEGSRKVSPLRNDVEGFINSWLALETLAMPNTTNEKPIKRKLEEIHDLTAQRAGEVFPIRRLAELRGEVVHQGKLEGVKPELLWFMADVFVDLLMHFLGLPSGERTRKYLDGRAQGYF